MHIGHTYQIPPDLIWNDGASGFFWTVSP